VTKPVLSMHVGIYGFRSVKLADYLIFSISNDTIFCQALSG